MPPDRDIPGSPQEWLERAKGHLALAKQPKPEGAFWEDQCFLLQQAAEKALKAIHQDAGLVFHYTHDLEELGTTLETNGVSIPSVVKEAVILTRYAFETRYPGPFEPVTEEEYRASIMASATLKDLECHGSAPRRPPRKALERSGPSATWPEVADTVIKAEYREAVRLAEAVVAWADKVMIDREHNDGL